jgi:ribosome-associated toxin RatA of RatAB toxin-antitoxin module
MATDSVIGSRVDHLTAAGRQYVRWLLLCAAMVAVAGATPLAAPDGEPQVTVTESAGVYQVTARFSVPEAQAIAIAVLTDYERIPKFMPDVQTSTVLERSEAGALIEQEAVARFLMFSKRVHLLLRIDHRDGTIRFRDECGRSFARYEGLWTITNANGRTAIEYQLGAKPRFEVPGFVLARLLKRDAFQMIALLQGEIMRRGVSSPGPQ